MQGYNVLSVSPGQVSPAGYDACLYRLLVKLLDRREHKEGSVLIDRRPVTDNVLCLLNCQ